MAYAQGTAFTYQGRLNNSGVPANGNYDMSFTLFTTNVTGSAVAGPVTNTAVQASNGLFSTVIDFGNVFNGASNWLEIAVSTNAANVFSILAPRQQLTPVPYAITAANVTGVVNASQLSGSIPATSLQGNGSGLTNLNPMAMTGVITNGPKIVTTTNFISATNPVVFTGFSVHAECNGTYTWNAEMNCYSNSPAALLFYSAVADAWMVGVTNKDDGAGTHIYFTDDGNLSGGDISGDFDQIIWTVYGGALQGNALLKGPLIPVYTYVTNAITRFFATPNITSTFVEGDAYNNGTNNSFSTLMTIEHEYSLVSYNGRLTIYGGTNSGYAATFDSEHNYQGGLTTLRLNAATTYLGNGDNRSHAFVGFVYGTNGNMGASCEFLERKPMYYYTAEQQSGNLYAIAEVLYPNGHVSVGNHPYTTHGIWAWAPGWLTIKAATQNLYNSSNTVDPQIVMEPSSDPTIKTNGAMWSSTNQSTIMFTGHNVNFPIPQVEQTNVALTAASSFTWQFQFPFADTNYSVTTTGAGAAIISPSLGAKTTNSVVINMVSFTGILNAIAAH